MGFATGSNALSTGAEEIFPANYGISFREVKNTDTSISVYIGGSSTVASSNGHLLKAGEAFAFDGGAGRRSVWAVSASGTPTITTIEW